MDLDYQLLSDPYLINKFQFIKKIGEGCFGKIYEVRNKQFKIKTALKIQIGRAYGKKMLLYNQIELLKRLQGKPGVTKMYSYGSWKHGLFVQIQILSNDLNQLVENQLSIQQMQNLAVKLLIALQSLHSSNVIHQDIKPQNIMQNSKKQYYFIDFGISKLLKNTKSQNMKVFSRKKGFIGTPRYASISAHLGQDQSKKDDIESLLYNLAYLYYKKLPWLCLKVSGNRKIQEIKNSKIKHSDQVFLEMGDNFIKAYEYVRLLSPYEQPNYNFLMGLFKRNKTQLLLNCQFNHAQEWSSKRNNAKKISLNVQKSFLRVPKMLSFDEDKSNLSKALSTRVHTSNEQKRQGQESQSDDDSMQQFELIDCDKQKVRLKSDDNTKQSDLNLNSYSDIEPELPNISKYVMSIKMKNPFFP